MWKYILSLLNRQSGKPLQNLAGGVWVRHPGGQRTNVQSSLEEELSNSGLQLYALNGTIAEKLWRDGTWSKEISEEPIDIVVAGHVIVMQGRSSSATQNSDVTGTSVTRIIFDLRFLGPKGRIYSTYARDILVYSVDEKTIAIRTMVQEVVKQLASCNDLFSRKQA